jgi:hypothetical protein
MKRILSLLITLTLVVTLVGLGNVEVKAVDPTYPDTSCTTGKTLYVHYHRWDETYTDTTIWAWGYGANGSGAGAEVYAEDGFGAIYEICIDDASTGDDAAGKEVGLINKYSAAWGDGFTDRDAVDTDLNGSKDGNHKNIVIQDDNGYVGFDANGVKHVYVFEGSNQVIYADDANSLPYSTELATIAVIYYDAAEDYAAWNMWTWSTGTLGTVVGGDNAPYGGSGIPLVSQLGVDGGEVENFRVGFINVDPADMGTEIGFIMRTDAWEKKFDGDIMISTEGLTAGDFKTVFYVAGEGSMFDTFEAFEAKVNFFEIASATALDPTSIEVVFNKDVLTLEDDVDVFNAGSLMVKDVDGNEVEISSVSYNSTTKVNDTFTIITETALTGDNSPYKVYYMPGGSEFYTKQFDVDNTPPVITIIGSTNVTKQLGDTYSLPTYSASDMVGEESVAIYNVKIKDGHGTVDTRNAGVYEIVITAHDKFGNVAEEMITVTVVDPCAVDNSDAAGFNPNVIALIVGIPLAFGAVVALRKH